MCAGLGGCSAVPGVPPPALLPVDDIILNASCELRFALMGVGQRHPAFLADEWAISLTLAPKVDTDLSLRAGLTGKSTSSASAKYFNTWVVGSGPGLEYDMKGHTDGQAVFKMTSTQLLDPVKYPLPCETNSSRYHALARVLGIEDWLERSAAAAEGKLGRLTRLDNPTLNSDITITWDGAGSFTYNFPLGTNFLGAFAQYKADESLSIAFARNSKPKPVHTLPNKTAYSSVAVPSSGITPAADNTLEILGLKQSIINLQTATARRR